MPRLRIHAATRRQPRTTAGVAARLTGLLLAGLLLGTAQPAVSAAPLVPALAPPLIGLAPQQVLSQGGWRDYQGPKLADINGDGRADLIWNSTCQLSGNSCVSNNNYLASAISRGDGRFVLHDPQWFGNGWAGYDWFTGDVGANGRADVLWTKSDGTTSYAYVADSNGDGSFALGDLLTFSNVLSATANINVGDFNGDGRTDLYFGSVCSLDHGLSACLHGSNNEARMALSDGVGGFDLQPKGYFGTGWDDYHAFFGDVDGDGNTDVVWNSLGHTAPYPNYIYVGLSDGLGHLTLTTLQTVSTSGWQGYETLTGDVNGDGRMDLIWLRVSSNDTVYVGLSNGDGSFAVGALQTFMIPIDLVSYWFAADFNGDGRDDLIFDSTSQTNGSKNYVHVALAGDGGQFTLLPQVLLGGDAWNIFDAHMGDVTGDGRADLVWSSLYQGPSQYANEVVVGVAGGFRSLLPLMRR